LKNKNLFRPPLHFFGLKSEGVFFIPYCSLKNCRQRLACESYKPVHIQQLKYVSCSAAETESDIGKHAKTACGHFLLRQNDGIKGYEREMFDHKTICGGLFRQDLNSLQ
jgi:hypothetical protein